MKKKKKDQGKYPRMSQMGADIRARRMWYCMFNKTYYPRRKCGDFIEKHVAVLDVSDTDALIEQAAMAIRKEWEPNALSPMESDKRDARAVLESLGIITKRRAKSNG